MIPKAPVTHWTPSPALSPFTYLGVGSSPPSLRMRSTGSSSCALPPCRWQRPQPHGSPLEGSTACCSHLLAWPHLPRGRRLTAGSAHPRVSGPTSAHGGPSASPWRVGPAFIPSIFRIRLSQPYSNLLRTAHRFCFVLFLSCM